MDYFVYILFSGKLDRYYIGQTVNIDERLKQHNSGLYDEASTKVSIDWKLFWSLKCQFRKQAIQIASHIKRMRNKVYSQNLTEFPEILEKLLLKYN